MLAHIRVRPLAWLVVVLLALVPGCGGEGRSSVSGKITLNDEPVTGGSILFQPTEGNKGQSAGATINSDGAYTIAADKGPLPGEYLVQISWPKPTGRKLPAVPPSPPGTMRDEVKEAVPADYNTKSTLRRDINSGANTLNFHLPLKGG